MKEALHEIKELVRIYPGIKQKYVIVRAMKNGTESWLLWGNPDIKWHKDILEEMKDAGIEVVEALGGGWLFVDPEKGVVHVWGESDRLGPAPMNLVRKLLGEGVIEKELSET